MVKLSCSASSLWCKHYIFPPVQLQGEIEVIHTAKVRYDWNGEGKLDLSVHQGDSVEILRVTGNPGGRWLARTMNGNCKFTFQSIT